MVFGMQGSGFSVSGFEFGVKWSGTQGSGFGGLRIQGAGFRIQGLRLKVEGC